jgi:hypothetical protein
MARMFALERCSFAARTKLVWGRQVTSIEWLPVCRRAQLPWGTDGGRRVDGPKPARSRRAQMIKPAGAADPAHGRPSRLALYHLQRWEEVPANFDNTLAIKRNFAEGLNNRHRFSSLEHLCEGARMRRGGAGAGATRVLGASPPRSGVGRGRRPHHVACASRVISRSSPRVRPLAARHRTLVGFAPGIRAARPFDGPASRLFCRLSRSHESPSAD